jgi:acyl phosphate:glycerol-3-phosphate acyltransferase
VFRHDGFGIVECQSMTARVGGSSAVNKVAVSAPLLLAAYALGATPSGYIVGRFLRGIDIREHGSGSIGATNVLRTLGPAPAAAVLAFDTAKGALPALAARLLGLPLWVQFSVGLVALAGHVWPVTLSLRGGRGVATGSGLLFAVAPRPALLVAALFAAVLGLTRYVSLASILGSLSAPILLHLWGYPPSVVLLNVAGSGLIVWRHRGNIRRLLDGTESRIGQRVEL